jgi:hypothetical protein
MRRLILVLVAAAATLMLTPGAAVADPNNDAATFELHLELPNVSQAPNGDQIAVTGSGEFSVHPKSVTASGGFTHTDSQGGLIASGTWTSSELLSFEFYGCGVIPSLGATLPPDFCGGALKLRALFTVTAPAPIAGFQVEGVLTIFCIIGPQAPATHDDPSGEGISLVVPGIANFNKIVSGMNVYIQTS